MTGEPGRRRVLRRWLTRRRGTDRFNQPRPSPPIVDEEWFRRRRAAERCLIPWIELSIPLTGKTVLEYGCGTGPVSCAFAPHVARHIGIDIDADGVELARRQAEFYGLENLHLETAPADEIGSAVGAFRGEVDIFMFYAVLEHMLVNERLSMLRLARDVVRPGGVIVICEAPNRLIAWDWHSSQLPFFAQLPDDLALLYAERSSRPDFLERIRSICGQDPTAAQTALTRFGRAMSFHELELVFGDLRRHTIASNWEPILIPEREVHVEELALARFMARSCPEVPPCFARYWIDVILTPDPLPHPRPTFLWPWTMETRNSTNVGWTAEDAIELLGPDSRLRVGLPVATRRLVLGVQSQSEDLDATVRSLDDGVPHRLRLQRRDGHPRYTTFHFGVPHQAFDVTIDAPGFVTFVGYEA